jgi:enterochelin esterase-like enzyme
LEGDEPEDAVNQDDAVSCPSPPRAAVVPGQARLDMTRQATDSGTRLAIQKPPADAVARVCVTLFDGVPMIEAGVPEALAAAQSSGNVPPLIAVYVESIEGAAKRGPGRCASLTTPAILDHFAGEFDAVLSATFADRRPPIVLIGHSLGAIAAIHLASHSPLGAGQVALLSAALWWPGEGGRLSGEAAMNELVAAPHVGVWMTAGDKEVAKLLRSNEDLAARLTNAAHPFERRSHPGAHDIRAADVVDAIASLCDTPPN